MSFDQEKDLAWAALQKRGSPPYDPEIYVKKEAWKLS